MRQKTNSSPPRVDILDSHGLRIPDAEVPLFRLPDILPVTAVQKLDTGPAQTLAPRGQHGDEPGAFSTVGITDSPVITGIDASPATVHGLTDYLLKPAMLRGMQPADPEGFRYVVGRKFADVKGIGTVHIEFDASINAHRASDLYKRLPPGVVLFKNPGEATWSPIPVVQHANPLKRPLTSEVEASTGSPAKRPVSVPEPVPELPVNAIEAHRLLLEGPFKSLYPEQTPEERAERLRGFNLSPRQHARLLTDLSAHLQLPAWLETHRLQSIDPDHPARFEHMRKDIEPLLIALRNDKYWDNADIQNSVSREFYEAFLSSIGYLRNTPGNLYRTDTPGVFRADDRSPFELALDGRMLPRMKHPKGATTDIPISSTVSLKLLSDYNTAPDPEYLLYNTQHDRRPGRRPDEMDDSEVDASLDDDGPYETIRHEQRLVFNYAIDTRGMEVVLNEENRYFNRHDRQQGAWLPDDSLEAHVSVAKDRGIDSARIWLLDSSLTRAAKIDDLAEMAGDQAQSITDRTHAGARNMDEYDRLISAAASAGKPVLQLAGEAFSNDIAWPL